MAETSMPLSLVRAAPLSDEPGLGALSLPGYLREVIERYTDREALVLHHGDGIIRWSYGDLWQYSLEVARALIAAGVSRDSRVGILMTNRPEYLSALFGTALAGGVVVSLNTFATPAELEHMLKVSGVSVLLFEDQVLKKNFSAMLTNLEPRIATVAAGELRSVLFPFLSRLVSLPGVTAQAPAGGPHVDAIEHWDDFLREGGAVSNDLVEARAAAVHPGDAGGLFFSSGTTSQPKAILHSQRAFAIQFWRWPRLWGVSEPARCWTGNGFFWSGPLTIIVGSALSTGGSLVLQPLFDAEAALELIQTEKVTLMNGRPHQWARMRAAKAWAKADLSSLRQVSKGQLILEHPTVNTDWDTPNAFGTTETMSILSSLVVGDAANQDARNFGALLPGNSIKVIDPHSGAVVPLGERGEVCIKGPTLMTGYVGKSPEEVFDDEGFYRTGDGGYIDAEGHLFWEGRLNDIIKSGGANVSPEEVDNVIARISGVKRSQTVGVPHEALGEMAVSCIVPVEGERLDEAAVIDYLKQHLASYKLPRKVLFFSEEEFALTGNEKVKAGEVRTKACARLGIC